MKCWVLWVENKHSTLYKNAQCKTSCGNIKQGIFRENIGFFIPENCKTINIHSRMKTFPLYIVDSKTSTALMFTNSTKIKEYAEKIVQFEQDGKILTQKIQVPVYEIEGNTIQLFPFSDETIAFKLNLLAKREFYEMLAKQLKMGLLKTLIYMGAGYGLFRFAEYVVRIIFLKQG